MLEEPRAALWRTWQGSKSRRTLRHFAKEVATVGHAGVNCKSVLGRPKKNSPLPCSS